MTHTENNTMMQAALEYAQRGLSVFPLKPMDKSPATTHGYKDATNDANQIKDWWGKFPNHNVGIATGAMSANIGVIDIDFDENEGKDGYEYLRSWEKEHGKLPETWTVSTARGGQHLYYRFIGDVPRNSTNEKLAVDFRGNGGYVMAPPSIHQNGKTVFWDLDPEDYELAIADDNVLAFIESIRPSSKKGEGLSKFSLPAIIKCGERDNVIFQYACSLQAQGLKDADIAVLVHHANEKKCEVPLPIAVVDQKINQALRYEKGDCVALAKTAKGAVKQTIDNCISVLSFDGELAGRFCYDEMSYTKMVRLPLPWRGGDGFKAVRDSDYSQLAAYMERHYDLNSKQKAIDAVLAICETNKVNQLTEWLDGLKWDGTDRVSHLFNICLGCADTAYNSEVAKLMLAGAVKRAYEPGCQFDTMVVIYGKQGRGKSNFVKRLAVRPEWYLDNLNTFEGDAAVEKLRGVWIAEVAELAAFKKQKDVESIKAFVSVRVDTIRPKYMRETEQRPRTCIMVGTTNDSTFLTDKTGNRRYLAIDATSQEPIIDMFSDDADSFIEQCWAQAVHTYKTTNPPLVLPAYIQEEALKAQMSHMEDDPRVGIIQEYLTGIEIDPTVTDKRVCVGMICEHALGMEKSEYYNKRAVSNEIARIMQNEIYGWEKGAKKERLSKIWGTQWFWEPSGYRSFRDKLIARNAEIANEIPISGDDLPLDY